MYKLKLWNEPLAEINEAMAARIKAGKTVARDIAYRLKELIG